MSLSVRDVCLQHQCCDLNQLIHSITLSNDANVEPRLVGRRLEVLEPRLDERDLLLVDRLDERGFLAQVRQAVLVPVVDAVCAHETICQRPLVFCAASNQNRTQNTLLVVRTGDELERTQGRVGAVGRIGAVGCVAPPGVGLPVNDREAVRGDVEPPKLVDVRDVRPLGDGEVLAGRVGLCTIVKMVAAVCAREGGDVRACRSARRTPWSGGWRRDAAWTRWAGESARHEFE